LSKNKQDTKIGVTSTTKLSPKTVETSNRIQELKSLHFRRTYAGHEHLSDKELEELYQTHPTLENYGSDSDIVRKLNDKNF